MKKFYDKSELGFFASGKSMLRVVILCVLVVAYTVVMLKTLPKGEQA